MEFSFDWDESKNRENQRKHGVSFEFAQYAFADPNRLILKDKEHPISEEERFYCVAKVTGGIITVRFTVWGNTIRIFGAGFWRKYRKFYLEDK